VSRIHFSAFIKDLQSINPRFKTNSSSLNELVVYLDRTAHKPSIFSKNSNEAIKSALNFCKNPNDPKLNKYKPAIGRIVEVWGQGHKAYPLGARVQKVDIKRICFRGDSRRPEVIFRSGFSKRKEHKNAEATYRNFETVSQQKEDFVQYPMDGMKKAGDLIPSSAVCVTPSLKAAALFPLPDEPKNIGEPIFVYMVYLERGYNTNLRQGLDFLTGISEIQTIEDTGLTSKRTYNKITTKNEITQTTYAIDEAREARVKMVGQALYGLEMAADAISAKHVFAALEIERTWKTVNEQTKNVDYKDGGQFNVVSIIRNQRASCPDGFEGVVDDFLTKANTMGGQMAVTADGFQPSLKL